MPGAKTGSKGKKKKSAKLTKAEKERLKKEEAERKAQEEEDARLRAEQEAREREERDRQEQEERRKLEEQERERHQAEIDKLREKIEQNKEDLLYFQKQKLQQEKWDRYMLCDGRPDPSSKKELNTFMNLWKDETEYKDFNLVLKECELTLELIAELKKSLEEDDELSDNDVHSYTESIDEMYSLLEAKMDEATMWMLRSPGKNVNPETENLQCVLRSKNFRVCIWGNTAKNPRVKSVDFPSEGFMIEIPKTLVLADVAVRLLYHNYDTMSPKCSTYLPKSKRVTEMESLPATETVIEATETATDKTEKVNEQELPVPKTPEPVISNLEPVREKSSSRKSRKSASRQSVASAKALNAEKEEPTKDVNDVEEKLTDLELKVTEDEDDLLDEDVVDLRSFSPMGPIAFIELLELPPQQQKVDRWFMQQIVSSDLKRLNYVTHLGKSLNESQYFEQESRHASSAKSNSSNPSTPNVSNLKPIAITFRIPNDVMLFEQPQLARWDESCCHWKLDGFHDIVYEEDNRTISFKTSNFGSIAIIQDLYLNMPFQSWELRPISLNHCLLTVVAANVDVEIEIKDSHCCLRKPDEKEILKGLLGKWMSPKKLIKKTRAAGINIFPSEDGEKYVSICKKDRGFVDSVYEQIALSSSAYAYCWSKWNGVDECPEDTVVLGAVEWCKDGQPTEDEYILYMASTRICYKLAMGEYDETFSKDIAENTQMHPGLFHMVQDGGKELAKQRVLDTSFQYGDCVYQLLKATNFLVYS